jgi:hypothetical protein
LPAAASLVTIGTEDSILFDCFSNSKQPNCVGFTSFDFNGAHPE